jgi:hypothetical protein
MREFSRPAGFEIADHSLLRSWMRVFWRFLRGVVPMWSRMTKNRSDLGMVLYHVSTA